MLFFFDGCDASKFREVSKSGLINGVTTNVSFTVNYAKEINENSYFDSIKPIYNAFTEAYADQHFSIQAIGTSSDQLLESALLIQDKFSEKTDLHIKIPVNYENLEVINTLTKRGVKVNATCITNFSQACMALQAGAQIISFFWGKMTDEGMNPSNHIKNTKVQIKDLGLTAKVLCGSIRQQLVITDIFESGADIVTLTDGYFGKMANSKKSEEATNIFDHDWSKSQLTLS